MAKTVTALTPTRPLTPTVVTQEPGSLWAELLSPGTWMALLAFLPTVWAMFHFPSGFQASAATAVVVAGLLCGPVGLVFYLISHAMKIKAGQSRWAYVEGQVVIWGKDLVKDPELSSKWIAEMLAAIHNPAVKLTVPLALSPVVHASVANVPLPGVVGGITYVPDVPAVASPGS